MLGYLKEKSLNEKVNIGLLSLVFFSLPFSFAMNSITVLAFVLFTLFFNRNTEHFGIKLSQNHLYLGSFFWLSCLWIKSFEINDMEFILRLIPLAIIPFTFLIQKDKFDLFDFTIIVSISSILAIGYGVYNAVEFYSRPDQHFTLIHLPHTLKGNYQAVYFSLQLGINIILLLFCFQKYNRKVIIVLVIIFLAVIVLLGKRMSLISLVLLGGIYTLTSFKKIAIFSLLAICLGFVFILYPYNKWRMEKASKMGEGVERIIMFESSINIIENNFFFGTGTKNVSSSLEQEYKREGIKTPFFANNPHNQYLYIFIGFGLVGFLIFLISQFYIVKYCWEMEKKYFLYLYLFFTLISLTEVILIRQQGIILFIFTLSFLFDFKKNLT